MCQKISTGLFFIFIKLSAPREVDNRPFCGIVNLQLNSSRAWLSRFQYQECGEGFGPMNRRQPIERYGAKSNPRGRDDGLSHRKVMQADRHFLHTRGDFLLFWRPSRLQTQPFVKLGKWLCLPGRGEN